MAAPIDPETGPFPRQRTMKGPATSRAGNTSQIRQAQALPSTTNEPQPGPMSRLVGAIADRRAQLLTAAGLLGGLGSCIIVALGLRLYLAGASRDLAAEIPALADGTDRVTAIAWSPAAPATLLAGTSLGRLYRVAGSGAPEEIATEAKGPIVTIFPTTDSNGRGIEARVVWLDPTAESGTPFRAEDKPTIAGLAALLGSELLPVDDVPSPQSAGAATSGSKKAPPSKSAQVQQTKRIPDRASISIDARSADGIVSAVGSAGQLDLPAGGTPQAVPLVGYRDGSMRVVSALNRAPIWVLRANADATTAEAVRPTADRSVVAIATRPGLSIPAGTAAFAWATANGDVRAVRFSAAGAAPRIERIEMAADALATAEPASVAVGQPVPIHPGKEGLAMSRDGGVLMIHGRDGIALARLGDAPTGDVAHVLQRYLPDELAARPVPLASGDVLRLQQALSARGFDPGLMDGLVGAKTQRALANYKAARALGDAQALCSLLLACAQLRISAAALAPFGEAFAIAGNDGVIRIVNLPQDLRDLPRAKPLRIRGHGEVISSLAFSSDGRHLASLGIDGRLHITDIPRARQIAGLPLHDLPSGPEAPDMAPISLPLGVSPPDARDPVVVLSSSDTLQAAQAESARVPVSSLSLGGPAIYQWRNTFNVVLRFPDAGTQLRDMLRLRSLPRWSRSAYPGQLSELCPSPVATDGFIRCNAARSGARASAN